MRVARDVPTWTGIDTHGGLDVIFEGNVVERTYRGVMATGFGAERVTVSNNAMSAASYMGIAVVDTWPHTMTGNVITASPTYGIFVEASACGTLTGNSVSASGVPVLDEGSRC